MSVHPAAHADLTTGTTAPSPRQETPNSAPQSAQRVTLLTGDVVTYSDDSGGHSTVSIEPASRPGPAPVFETSTSPDGYQVIPSDAASYLASGAVDPDLFDVKKLIAEGLADTASDKLPVILSYGDKPSDEVLSHRADDLPASDRTVTLPSVDAAAVQVNRAEAPAFWRALTDRPADRQAAGASTLGGGVTKVWLDRKVRASLDRSVPQIGAPEAWRAGLDGTGVKVAVLDTGIDAKHPDLAGRIAESHNFTTEPDTGDGYGHGTHVASIIAGSGAASGGRYHGVASGVQLLNGKVLDSTGSGDLSHLMAAMEWAVDSGARVVNMSLGAGPSDGHDPVSELVDKLTAKSGALFVVAAGNSGGIASVETPAAARSALAVGAVSPTDAVAAFSSRGPRLGDAMVKPEIMAPGVDITAARAAGTTLGRPVDDHYTRVPGTSMATPHVVGAAALLAQKYPSWRADELKGLLTTSAVDLGVEWYTQGAGRVDVGRALATKVRGPSSVSLGRLTSAAGQGPVRYTNLTDREIRLSLQLSVTTWTGSPAPNGVAKLDRDTLVVPAHGTAETTLTVDPRAGPAGAYGGQIKATEATSTSTTVRTPISFYKEAQMVELTVKMMDSRGGPPSSRTLNLVRDDYDWNDIKRNDPFLPPVYHVAVSGGTGKVMVPKGKYSTTAVVVENSTDIRRATLLANAEVNVEGPSTLTLDARKAVRMQVDTKEPTDTRERFSAVQRYLPGAPVAFASGVLTAGPGWQIYITPVSAAGRGTVASQDHLTLRQSLVDARVRVPQQLELSPHYDEASAVSERLAGSQDLQLRLVEPGDRSVFQADGVKGKAALVRIPVPEGTADVTGYVRQTAQAVAKQASAAGATAVLSYMDLPDALPITGLTGDRLQQLSLGRQEGDQLHRLAQQGDVRISITARSQPEHMYNLYFRDRNGVPSPHVNTVDPAKLVKVDTRYHADRPDALFTKKWFALPTDTPSSVALSGVKFQGPAQWTEYIGPADEKVFWKRYVSQAAPGPNGQPDMSTTFVLISEDVFRKAGQKPQERWFEAPIHAGAAVRTEGGYPLLCSNCRGDNGELLPAAQWMDSTGRHFAEPWQSGQYFAKTRLFQGGQEIPGKVTGRLPIPLFPLGKQTGNYRLETRNAWPDKPVPGWPNGGVHRLTPQTDTVSSFTSAPPAGTTPPGYGCLETWQRCAYQPIIEVGYQPGLDLLNQAPAGRVHTFDVTVGHHQGAESAGAISEFRLWYSVNDGTSWNRATVVRQGDGRYSVQINHPRLSETNGFVSLRAEAWDTAGNRVAQVMRRAYALTDKPAR